MKTFWKWLLLALIVAEVALVRFRLLDIKTAIGIFLAIEALLTIVGLRQVVVAVRRYRRDRGAGLDAWAALENGLETFLPRKLARAVAAEPKLWFYLGKWLLRRVRRGENEFSYHRKSLLGPLLIVLLFTTPAEVLLIELLLPWAWLRWLLLVLAIYAFLWVCGLYASMVARPHRLDGEGIRVRYGVLVEGEIPYRDIAAIEAVRRNTHGDGLRVVKGESAAYLSIGGNTDVTLRLTKPLPLQGWLSATVPVSAVHLAADEPQRLARELGRRLETTRWIPPSAGSGQVAEFT